MSYQMQKSGVEFGLGKRCEAQCRAVWLQDLKNELSDLQKQGEVKISATIIKKQLRKMPNWKYPGPDGMQVYWLKKFRALHQIIATQLNECLFLRSVPDWLTKGRTVLVVKDKGKGGDVANFRPTTCLPLMWKLFTGVLADTTYEHLERKSLLPEEQNGCRRNSRGTKDQLLIDLDKMILRNRRRRKRDLGMVWVDYKKLYDMDFLMDFWMHEHVWYRRKLHRGNPKQYETMEDGTDGW